MRRYAGHSDQKWWGSSLCPALCGWSGDDARTSGWAESLSYRNGRGPSGGEPRLLVLADRAWGLRTMPPDETSGSLQQLSFSSCAYVARNSGLPCTTIGVLTGVVASTLHPHLRDAGAGLLYPIAPVIESTFFLDRHLAPIRLRGKARTSKSPDLCGMISSLQHHKHHEASATNPPVSLSLSLGTRGPPNPSDLPRDML